MPRRRWPKLSGIFCGWNWLAFCFSLVHGLLWRSRAAGTSGSIPGRIALSFVVPEPVPTITRESIQIIHHTARSHRELICQAPVTVHAGAPGIDKGEVALFQSQNGDIGNHADAE